MNREEKQFNDLIFKHYSQSEMFDKIKHSFITVRKNLLIHDGFRNLFPKSQFEMCSTIINMANHTSIEALRQLSIRKDKKSLCFAIKKEKFLYRLTVEEINNKYKINLEYLREER